MKPYPINDTVISIKTCCRDKEPPKDANLSVILEQIGNGHWAGEIEKARLAFNADNIDEYKRLKARLPGIMFSGTFRERCNEGIIRHSGLLCLDFDHLDNMAQVKDQIINDPYTLACFVSPSGHGLKVLVRIPADPALHSEAFDQYAHYYQQLGMAPDKQCREVARLCFVSHDPKLFIRPDATPLKCYIDHTDNTGNRDKELCSLCNTPMTPEQVINATLPRHKGQRHRKVLDLARGLKFDAGLANKPLKELKTFVRVWHEKALPNIATRDFSETWTDFVHAWPRARIRLSEQAVNKAWAKTINEPLPDICMKCDSDRVKKLLALCWHLKGADGAFYLSTHVAGALLGMKPMQILRYLRMFTADEIIKMTMRGDRQKASTYSFI